jgi:SAM-dependent methyltransferase
VRYTLPQFAVRHCDRCGLMYRDPFPSRDEIDAMYDDPRYLASDYFTRAEEGTARPEVAIYEQGLDWLEARLSDLSRKLLDVGCGGGGFLALAQARGWDVAGVEISHEHAARVERELRIPVACADLLDADPPDGPFDVITLWDVLEHVTHPDATLLRAHDLLSPGGYLLVFTINSASLFNRLGALGYHATLGQLARPIELLYDQRHCYYFTEHTLDVLLMRSGLQIEERLYHRAHLGHWLVEPAPRWMLAAAELVDWLSVPLSLQYRQLVLCSVPS